MTSCDSNLVHAVMYKMQTKMAAYKFDEVHRPLCHQICAEKTEAGDVVNGCNGAVWIVTERQGGMVTCAQHGMIFPYVCCMLASMHHCTNQHTWLMLYLHLCNVKCAGNVKCVWTAGQVVVAQQQLCSSISRGSAQVTM